MFTYDLSGQLTNADHETQSDESYEYDAAGNRVNNGSVIGPDNRVLSDGTFTYSYDNEGNLTRKTTIATGEYTEFEFDPRNRLVRATTKSAGGIILEEVTYTYDVFNRNIARTVDRDGAGANSAQTTFTVYDGANAWADFDAAGDAIARYLFGDRMDEIIARFRPGEGTAWYLTDHLGTIHDIANASGQVANHIDYNSFGRILAQTNPAFGDRFTFTGREWDPELDLYYYRARFYDPSLGRFVSQDPLGFAAGDVNFYRYVGNQVLSATDPTGELAIVERIVRYIKDQPIEVFVALACPIAEFFAENGFVAPWNHPAKVAEAVLQQGIGFAAAKFLGGGMALAQRFILKSLTMKIAASVAAGVGGLGFATYGIYDAWKSGNQALFWVRLTCSAADLGIMVSSFWRALSRARMAQFAGTFDKAEFDRLNQLDVDTKQTRPGEAMAAARGQVDLGRMERATIDAQGGDFVIRGGPNDGKTVDFKITPKDDVEAGNINKWFEKNWPKFSDGLEKSLRDPHTDIVAIGINSLTPDNQAMVHALLNRLDPWTVAKAVLF